MRELEFDQLLASYLDEDIEEAELELLLEQVEKVPTYRHHFQRELRLHALTHEIAADRMEAMKLDLESVSEAGRLPENPGRAKRRRARKYRQQVRGTSFYFSAAAVVMLLALVTYAIVEGMPREIGYCVYISGKGNQDLIRSDKRLPLIENMTILAGDRIVNKDEGGVMLSLNKGAVVSMVGRTDLKIPENGAADVDLNRGEIKMEVTPSSDIEAPIVVSTPDSISSGLDTVFSIKTNDQVTRLDVHEGIVNFSKLHNDEVIHVQAKMFAVTDGPMLKIKNQEGTNRTTVDLLPVADGFTENGRWYNDQYLKVEGNKRVSYLRFRVEGVDRVKRAVLYLTQVEDEGKGVIMFFGGSHDEWQEIKAKRQNLPDASQLITKFQGAIRRSQTIGVDLSSYITGNGEYTIIMKLVQSGSNDIWFNAKESRRPPILRISQ